jgi:hypothetical protein
LTAAFFAWEQPRPHGHPAALVVPDSNVFDFGASARVREADMATQRNVETWKDCPMFEEPRDALYRLQRWYVAQCDDEWEHSYGVRIDTIDNPGWSVRLDLKDTVPEHTSLDRSKLERSEHDWVHWRVADGRYEAFCGPTNLNEAISAFLDLAGARSPA